MATEIITQDLIKKLFSYNSETGIFTRKLARSNCVKTGERIGCANGQGYLTTNIKGKHYRVHRLAWLYFYGHWPKDQIDHINGVRDDNRICNLREADDQENRRNQKMPKDNTSGVIGVYWHKKRCMWYGKIKHEGTHFCLGYSTDKNVVIRARKNAEIKYGFHANHGR